MRKPIFFIWVLLAIALITAIADFVKSASWKAPMDAARGIGRTVPRPFYHRAKKGDQETRLPFFRPKQKACLMPYL